jgi:hypothetical protein
MFVMKVGTVDYYETPPQNKADLIQRLRGADAVFLDHSVLEAEVIQSGPKLKFICFFGIRYGNCINVAAATKQGVTVSYTPGYGATAVAEYTLGLMLALTRHIAASYYSLKHGEWLSAKFQGVDLEGKTLGIVGLGPIGADMARLGAGVGMKLLGWTQTARRTGPVRPPPRRAGPTLRGRGHRDPSPAFGSPDEADHLPRSPGHDEVHGLCHQHVLSEARRQPSSRTPAPTRKARRGCPRRP